MREQSMQAGLSVRFERAPDYFALHEAHSADHVTWIVTRRGRVVSTVSAVVFPAYVDRSLRTVAYFSDLRQAAGRGLGGLWRSLAAAVVDEIRRELGATHAYCSILRDNRLARASILDSALGRSLGIRHLRGYRTVSIVGTLPWPRWQGRRIDIRSATVGDGEALREFIDSVSRDLQYAPMLDPQTWRRRTEGWPDFSIGNFLIARNPGGRIVGCLAPWDSSRINRIVIDALPLRAELLRRAVNATTLVTRRPGIAVGPGSHLPDLSLTHVLVENRDPDVFAALLTAAFRVLRRSRRYATLSCCIYDGDPLWAALQHTVRSSVPMDLYSFLLDRSAEPPADESLWPGFESYLA
jgi:hypothetical protein